MAAADLAYLTGMFLLEVRKVNSRVPPSPQMFGTTSITKGSPLAPDVLASYVLAEIRVSQ